MSSPERASGRDPKSSAGRRLDRAGWLTVGLGIALILWGVLFMDSRALGTRTRHEFAERRSYDQVKSAAHAAFPGFVLRAGSGLLLVLAGSELRRRGGRA